MAVRIEVRNFSGSYAPVNAPPADYPVGMAELVNKAITVGGLPRNSTAYTGTRARR
jgi:hypothetical protein